MTAIATTAATPASVGDSRASGIRATATIAASNAPGTAISSPSTIAGTSTWPPEAPRLRARAIVACLRRAASTAISASVATATSAGPIAMTAMIPSAAAQRAWCASRIAAIPVRSAVSIEGVMFADGYRTSSRRKSVASVASDRSLIRSGSRNSRHE